MLPSINDLDRQGGRRCCSRTRTPWSTEGLGRSVGPWRAFANEGARVFLAGRTLATLDEAARELAGGGGGRDGQVDALDERAVDATRRRRRREGRRHRRVLQRHRPRRRPRRPAAGMSLEDFARPVRTAMRTHFLTTRAAARHADQARVGCDHGHHGDHRPPVDPRGGRDGGRLRRHREPVPPVGMRAGQVRRPGRLAPDDRPSRPSPARPSPPTAPGRRTMRVPS